MKKLIVGVDISSKTLDICIKDQSVIEHQVIENEVKAIRSFFRKYAKDDLVVAMGKHRPL